VFWFFSEKEPLPSKPTGRFSRPVYIPYLEAAGPVPLGRQPAAPIRRCDVHAVLTRSVFDQVVLAIAQATSVGTTAITLECRLDGDLALGGFRRLKLALYLEEVFDTELPDEAIDRFVTVGDIVTYMKRHDFAELGVTA
jgi:acyl carrier protein